jgi:hypothetical protein
LVGGGFIPVGQGFQKGFRTSLGSGINVADSIWRNSIPMAAARGQSGHADDQNEEDKPILQGTRKRRARGPADGAVESVRAVAISR